MHRKSDKWSKVTIHVHTQALCLWLQLRARGFLNHYYIIPRVCIKTRITHSITNSWDQSRDLSFGKIQQEQQFGNFLIRKKGGKTVQYKLQASNIMHKNTSWVSLVIKCERLMNARLIWDKKKTLFFLREMLFLDTFRSEPGLKKLLLSHPQWSHGFILNISLTPKVGDLHG